MNHFLFESKNLYKKKNFIQEHINLNFLNLNFIQKNSYNFFLQKNIFIEKRHKVGLEKLFLNIFPIKFNLNTEIKISIRYKSYNIGILFQNSNLAKINGETFSFPLILTLEIEILNKFKIDKKLISISLGELPLLTQNNTFIINGIERTILNQLERTSILSILETKSHTKNIKLIPYKGVWIELYKSKKNNDLIFNLKKVKPTETNKKEISLILLYKLLNFTLNESISFLFPILQLKKHNSKPIWKIIINFLELKHKTLIYSLNNINSDTIFEKKHTFYKKKNFIQILNFKFLKLLINDFNKSNYILITQKLTTVNLIDTSVIQETWKLNFLKELMLQDHTHEKIEELINSKLNTTFFNSIKHFLNLFMLNSNYNLSSIGRLKLNILFGINVKKPSLSTLDILFLINNFINQLTNNINEYQHDIVDRSIRSIHTIIHDLLEYSLLQFKKTVTISNKSHFQQLIKHNFKMDFLIRKIFNRTYFQLIQKNFFNTSPLSQVVDQMNPLSELTHKRKITLLGPGGLSIETATLTNRDINRTEYGKICPIETPEGSNVGLVNTLSIYTKLDDYKLLQSPYLKIKNGIITNNISYLNVLEERNEYIALDIKYFLTNKKKELVFCRYNDTFIYQSKNKINYCEIHAKQILSISSSMIPFLEHNDASRALMGANMQRQAVSLLFPEPPLIGTNVESIIKSKSSFISNKINFSGIIENIDSYILSMLIINYTINKKNNYSYSNFKKINSLFIIKNKIMLTLNQHSFLKEKFNLNFDNGEVVSKNNSINIINTLKKNNLALGNNLLVAFMSFSGQTFEDSIILSEKILEFKKLTSFHLDFYESTEKNSISEKEIFTKEIPGKSIHLLSHLNYQGFPKIGSRIKKNDVLIGKIKILSKYLETLSSEMKFLEAVFKSNSKNKYVDQIIDISELYKRDQIGIVLDIHIFYFNKKSQMNVQNYNSFFKYKIYFYKKYFSFIWKILLLNKIHTLNIIIKLIQLQFDLMLNKIKQCELIEFNRKNSIERVKVTVGWIHCIKSGDKLTGRHGNKGIISKVSKKENMPFLEDGTIIDIILNPLGIISRMNLGQIYETQLSLLSYKIGKYLKNILFNKSYDFNYIQIKHVLKHLYGYNFDNLYLENLTLKELLLFLKNLNFGLEIKAEAFNSLTLKELNSFNLLKNFYYNGQYKLYDGKTGYSLDRNITIGYMYIMKLYHFVDEKMHARSTGPYALLTQQPLRGKSRIGGQRFGEMEVWALQGYGSAYTLQEIVTIKSDSIEGRTNVFSSYSGDEIEMGIPECFYVLIRELWALGLYIRGIKSFKKSNLLKLK